MLLCSRKKAEPSRRVLPVFVALPADPDAAGTSRREPAGRHGTNVLLRDAVGEVKRVPALRAYHPLHFSRHFPARYGTDKAAGDTENGYRILFHLFHPPCFSECILFLWGLSGLSMSRKKYRIKKDQSNSVPYKKHQYVKPVNGNIRSSLLS